MKSAVIVIDMVKDTLDSPHPLPIATLLRTAAPPINQRFTRTL